jgi:hypothetical protein
VCSACSLYFKRRVEQCGCVAEVCDRNEDEALSRKGADTLSTNVSYSLDSYVAVVSESIKAAEAPQLLYCTTYLSKRIGEQEGLSAVGRWCGTRDAKRSRVLTN